MTRKCGAPARLSEPDALDSYRFSRQKGIRTRANFLSFPKSEATRNLVLAGLAKNPDPSLRSG
jgi:hypothetical protein